MDEFQLVSQVKGLMKELQNRVIHVVLHVALHVLQSPVQSNNSTNGLTLIITFHRIYIHYCLKVLSRYDFCSMLKTIHKKKN